MSNFKHHTFTQNLINIVTRLAATRKWTVTCESQKSVSAFSRPTKGDPSIVTNIYVQWLDDKAILAVDFNYWKSKTVETADHIQIDITTEEANRIAAKIEENTIVNWSRQGLEIPEVEVA